MGISSNSSAKSATSVTFTCICCSKNVNAKPLTFTHESGHQFLVCKSCYWRLDHLANKIHPRWRTAMAFLGNLDGVA